MEHARLVGNLHRALGLAAGGRFVRRAEEFRPTVRDFFCGHMDPYRMIVNLDYGQPFEPPKSSYRSEPTDFQRGELEIDGHNLYFDEWEYKFEVKTTPLDVSTEADPKSK